MTEKTSQGLRCVLCGGDHVPSGVECDPAGMDREIARLGAKQWNNLSAQAMRPRLKEAMRQHDAARSMALASGDPMYAPVAEEFDRLFERVLHSRDQNMEAALREFLWDNKACLLRAVQQAATTSSADSGWRIDVENAPKDGSTVIFPINGTVRAFWCNDLKQWVLCSPLHIETVCAPAKWKRERPLTASIEPER